MKTLILVGHPDLPNSSTQAFLQASLTDVAHIWQPLQPSAVPVEQARGQLVAADRILFQFPLYWYAAPAVVTDWLAQVFTPQWLAQGGLREKELGIVVSTGQPARDFQSGGTVGTTLDALMAPFQVLARQAQMHWLPIFGIYQFHYLTEAQKRTLLIDYQRYVNQPAPDNFQQREAWLIQRLRDRLTQTTGSDQSLVSALLATLETNQATLEQLQMTLQDMKGVSDND